MSREFLVSLLTFVYVAFSVFRVAFYYPQISRVWRSRDAADISISTWFIWTANNALGALYSSVVLSDIWFSLVFIANMLCTAFITQMAWAKQHAALKNQSVERQSTSYFGEQIEVAPSDELTTSVDSLVSNDMRRFHPESASPTGDWIFVFGCNLNGRHSRGLARLARESFGAQIGVSTGLVARSYAIPVRGTRSRAVGIYDVETSVAAFIVFARQNPGHQFFVSRISERVGTQGESTIARFFVNAPHNCSFPEGWRQHLGASSIAAKRFDADRLIIQPPEH